MSEVIHNAPAEVADYTKVNAARERLGVSVADLCSAANISESTFHRAKRHRSVWKAATLERIVSALEEFERERTLRIERLERIAGERPDAGRAAA